MDCLLTSKLFTNIFFSMVERIKCPTCRKFTLIGSYCEHCSKSLNTCAACGAGVLGDAIFCPRCGALISEEKRLALTRQRVAWYWWLLPVASPLLLLSPWVGGAVAWAVNRYRNPRISLYILLFGIALSIILVVVTAVLGI